MLKILIIIITIFAVLLIMATVWGSLECRALRVREISITDSGLGDMRIALLSDYHNNHKISDKLYNELSVLKPDIICVPGDMTVCRQRDCRDNLRSAELLVQLSDIAPVYYSMGNHELGMSNNKNNMLENWNEYTEIIDSCDNVFLLDNDSILKNGIEIAGLSLDGSCYKRFSGKRLTEEDIDSFIGKKSHACILLAHTPEYYSQYCEWGANLILSGHNHGGLVRLPWLGGVLSSRLHVFPRYDYGLYRNEKSCMFISNGLGSHKPKIRFNNKPELQILELKS